MKLMTQADSNMETRYIVVTEPTMLGVGIYLKSPDGGRLRAGKICEINNDGTMDLCRDFTADGFRCDNDGHIVTLNL